MSYITEPEAMMTAVDVAPGEELLVTVVGGQQPRARCPELVKALLECTGFANERLDQIGESTRIRVLLEDAG